jgi:hypothetical protein
MGSPLTPQMELATGTIYFYKPHQFILYIGFHGLGLFVRMLHKISTSISILISGMCMLYHNFY